MSAFNNATKFFHACEGLEGPSGTAHYVAEGAGFECQAQALTGIETVQDYAGWLAGLDTTALAGARYRLDSSAWDAESNCALFLAPLLPRIQATAARLRQPEKRPIPIMSMSLK